MTDLLKKLNYKGQVRIAVINADVQFSASLESLLPEVRLDKTIDPRFPYSFMVLFVKKAREIDNIAPLALHNLVADGILWFCYPKKTSKTFKSDISRDSGWKTLNEAGFHGIRTVSIDDDWSAMRFRNIKYIKSASGRFSV